MSSEYNLISFQTFLDYLVGSTESLGYQKDMTQTIDHWLAVLSWPPNMFAVTSALLEETGAYTKLVSPSSNNCSVFKDFQLDEIQNIASQWAKGLENIYQPMLNLFISRDDVESIKISEFLLDESFLPPSLKSILKQVFTVCNLKKSMLEIELMKLVWH